MQLRNCCAWIAASISLCLIAQLSAAQNMAPSPLGSYARLNTYCGDQPIPKDNTAIPQFGCFLLSAGHAAEGNFSGHRVEVTVGLTGDEIVLVDGTALSYLQDRNRRPPSFTNLDYVLPTGGDSGFRFCSDGSHTYCPSGITVFSRNSDKSVLFSMSECLPPD